MLLSKAQHTSLESPGPSGFGQKFGFHPAVAGTMIAVDLMLNGMTYATFGVFAIMELMAAIPLGIITYMAQRKWYDDDHESALIKAMIVALLTAIPAPISPILAPSGLVGLFHRRKDT